MNLMHDIIQDLTKQILDKFESKFREACEIWGVNLNDHEEIKRRCQIVQYEGSPIKEFRIDGNYVMAFTEVKPDPVDFNEPLKMSASFQCSEIARAARTATKQTKHDNNPATPD